MGNGQHGRAQLLKYPTGLAAAAARGWGVSGLPAGLCTLQQLAESVETQVTWWCSVTASALLSDHMGGG